jgi:hypothetical protein
MNKTNTSETLAKDDVTASFPNIFSRTPLPASCKLFYDFERNLKNV